MAEPKLLLCRAPFAQDNCKSSQERFLLIGAGAADDSGWFPSDH
jgi:hypothetical protein